MDFFANAFKSLNNLNEEVFDLSVTGNNAELKDFLDNDEQIDTLTIIDDEAEDEEELEDSYIGKVILDCNVCHTLIYKDPSEVVLDGDVANIEDECPYCYSQDGYKVVGQVKPFEEAEEDAEQAELEDEPEEAIEDEEEASDDFEEDGSEEEDDDDEMEESVKIRRKSAVLTEGKIQIPTVTNNNSDKVRKALKAVYEEVKGLTDKVNNKLRGVDEKKFDKVRAFCDKKVRNKYYEIITEAFATFPISRKLMLKYLADGLKSADSIRGFREFFVTIKQKFYSLASNVNLDSVAKYDGSGEKDTIASNGRLKNNVGNNMDKYFAKALGFDMEESLKEGKNCDDCDEEELDEFLDFGCVNAQGQTIGVGVGGGTGISNGQAPGGLDVPGMGEDLEEDKDCENCDEEELDECGDSLKESADGSVKDFLDKMNKCSSKKEVEKIVAAAKGNPNADEAYKQWKSKDESLEEGFNKVDIETDDQHLAMESDESGRVTVTSEPKEPALEDMGGETIGEVDLGTEAEIEDNQGDEEDSEEEAPAEEGEDEEEFSEFDEESFDDLGESYLKKVYENVDSFKTSKVKEEAGKLCLEGTINFKSGASKKTSFIFENKGTNQFGEIVFEGYNKEITRAGKGFGLRCINKDKTLICEKLSYRYNVNKSLVEGFVQREK